MHRRVEVINQDGSSANTTETVYSRSELLLPSQYSGYSARGGKTGLGKHFHGRRLWDLVDGTCISHTSVAEIAKLVFLIQWRFLAGIFISALIKSSGSCMPWQSDIPRKCEVHVHILLLMEGTMATLTELRGGERGGESVGCWHDTTSHHMYLNQITPLSIEVVFVLHQNIELRRVLSLVQLRTKPFRYSRGSKIRMKLEEVNRPDTSPSTLSEHYSRRREQARKLKMMPCHSQRKGIYAQ